MNSPNHLWFWKNGDLLQGSFFFWMPEKNNIGFQGPWTALIQKTTKKHQGAIDLQQMSAHMIVHSAGNYMHWQFLCTILADLIVTHPDSFHKFSLRGHMGGYGIGSGQKVWQTQHPKLTTTESNFSNLTPSRSLVITHLEMFLLPFVEVVILKMLRLILP